MFRSSVFVLATVLVAGCSAKVTLSLEPGQAAVAIGGMVQFRATVANASSTGVRWTVQEGASGGTVSATGLYTAPQSSGTYHVVAVSEADSAATATATVTVNAAGPVKVTLTPATAMARVGQMIAFDARVTGTENGRVTWSVVEGASGGQISATGVYTTPATPGVFHVRATSEADAMATAIATLTVTDGISVSLTPPTAKVRAGGDFTFTATVTGTANQAVTWIVEEGAVGGTVTTGGVYSAPSVTGTYHVTARSREDATRSATAVVTVVVGAMVTVAPASTLIGLGATVDFTATVTGAADTRVTWSVKEAGGGTITAAGRYTAPASIGSFTVVATSVEDPGATASASVTVLNKVAVSVSPLTKTIEIFEDVQLTATVVNATNTDVTWSVDEVNGGTVDATGRYSAPSKVGTYHVTATSVEDPTAQAKATFTVIPEVLIIVLPEEVTLQYSQTQQFTATLSTGGPAQVLWSVIGDGTITATGLYTAPANPTFDSIVAELVGNPNKNGFANVEVNSPGTVEVTPAQVDLAKGQTQQFTAKVVGLANQAVTWSVSAGSGTVSASGLYTAPNKNGLFTVTAKSVADPTVMGTGRIDVLHPSASLSGTVAYAGSKPGRIRLRVVDQAGADLNLGTSIPGPGPFTIRGLQRADAYEVHAFKDVGGTGFEVPENPSGSAAFTFDGAVNVTGVNVTVVDSPPPPLTAPFLLEAALGGAGAVVLWEPDDFIEHRLYWSSTPNPGPTNKLGVVTVRPTLRPVAFVSLMAPVSALHFALVAVQNGVESAPKYASASLTPGGGALSVEVSLPSPAPTGKLYVLAVNESTGSLHAGYVDAPQALQTVTLTGLSAGRHVLRGYLDRGRVGELDPADLTSEATYGLRLTVAVKSSGTVTAPRMVLAGGDRKAIVATEVRQAPNALSQVALTVVGGNELPAGAALMSGPGVTGIRDLVPGELGLFSTSVRRTAAPAAGDAYALAVSSPDGGTSTLTATVARSLPIATTASPSGTASVMPTFTWSFTPALPADTWVYVEVQMQQGLPVWRSNWLSPTTTSVAYNVDGTAFYPLSAAVPYEWLLHVVDSNGNHSVTRKTFTAQ